MYVDIFITVVFLEYSVKQIKYEKCLNAVIETENLWNEMHKKHSLWRKETRKMWRVKSKME